MYKIIYRSWQVYLSYVTVSYTHLDVYKRQISFKVGPELKKVVRENQWVKVQSK